MMNDKENVIEKVKDNKKEIKENFHIILIILLVAFIIIDIIIIIYVIKENDKFHNIYTEATKSESIQIRDYLLSQGVEAFLNEAGKVLVAKENIDYAIKLVDQEFFPETIKVEEEMSQETNIEELTPTEIMLETTQLEQNIVTSLENHVSINKAVVRIEDYKSDSFDVNVVVILTTVNAMEIQQSDIDSIKWVITNLVEDSKVEDIVLINSDTNKPFFE